MNLDYVIIVVAGRNKAIYRRRLLIARHLPRTRQPTLGEALPQPANPAESSRVVSGWADRLIGSQATRPQLSNEIPSRPQAPRPQDEPT